MLLPAAVSCRVWHEEQCVSITTVQHVHLHFHGVEGGRLAESTPMLLL